MKTPLFALSFFAITQALSLFAHDVMIPSQNPPIGLAVEAVPQFVMIGFDDNPQVDPLEWIIGFLADRRNPAGTGQAATFDGVPARAAFYSNGLFLDPSRKLRDVHLRAFREGHEVGNHTYTHNHGGEYSVEEWKEEIVHNRQALSKAQIPRDAQTGFRAPFLEYTAATFGALVELGFVYDSSIEEGYQAGHDGTNFYWPYTLDHGSPGNRSGWKEEVGSHPGFWEIPIHVFMIPRDAEGKRDGAPLGLRERVRKGMIEGGWDWTDETPKITGMDWNVFIQAKLDGADFLAILKYNFDLRMAGNRAPFMVGGHTALFPDTEPERRAAMEAFIDYVLSKPEVRLVTPQQLVEWLRQPMALAK